MNEQSAINLKSFEDYLSTTSTQVPVFDYVLNFVIAVMLAIILERVYVKYGRSLSNRKAFAKNFVMMTLITMLIISIVKSSLALSLGLVGALSIVRFRAAIKEPEELMYLFFAIAIGLGMGANQTLITIVASMMILGIIMIQGKYQWSSNPENLYLTVSSPKEVELENIVEELEKYCDSIKMKRYDYNDDLTEASFLVELKDYDQFLSTKKNLKTLGDSVQFTFIDNEGIF